VIEITAIDREHQTISGKDRHGVIFTFAYRLDTQVHRMSPTETVVSLASLISPRTTAFPVVKDQEVLINWIPDATAKGRIAVQFTILE